MNGFGTDLLRGKFGVPSGLGFRLRLFSGESGGVFLGIREPPDPVLGDESPCWVFSSTPLSMSASETLTGEGGLLDRSET